MYVSFNIFEDIAMLTLTSSEAQNTFGSVIDRSQREIVSVTRRGRVATLVMSPQVLEDYVDGILAMQAERNGMLTAEESEAVLNKFRHA